MTSWLQSRDVLDASPNRTRSRFSQSLARILGGSVQRTAGRLLQQGIMFIYM